MNRPNTTTPEVGPAVLSGPREKLNVGWPAGGALRTARPTILLALVALLLLLARAARAQLVPDGGTNVVDGIVTNVPGTNYIGSNAPSSLLVITNGGVVSNDFGMIGFSATSSNNNVLVTGVGSGWSNRSGLVLGQFASGNQLFVAAGALMSNAGTQIGLDAAASNNSLLVTGAGSRLSSRPGISVGVGGSYNSLAISGGAIVAATNTVSVGVNSGSSGNLLAVTGAGSQLIVRQDVQLGNGGSNNLLIVSNSGSLQLGSAGIGIAANARFNLAVVTGAGSQWINQSNLIIGFTGQSNELRVTDGGVVSAAGVRFGTGSDCKNSSVVVSGLGSFLDVRTNVTLGPAVGGGHQLVITNGGLVGCSNATIGAFASNCVAIVTGQGSYWSNRGDVSIGQNATKGNALLWVADGGMVANSFATIGGFSGPTHVAIVSGSGSIWSNRMAISLRNQQNGNLLVVSNGGLVFASNAVTVGTGSGGSGAMVVVDGGTLIVSNETSNGVLDVQLGTNRLNAGMIDVDQLLMTNAAGLFEFNGGLLRVKGTTNGNGIAFSVGDGVSAARFQLLGGTHIFSNNVVISLNATLTGNGTILGNVTNFGTLSPGSSAGAITINGDLALQPGATAVFELGGRAATNGYDQVTVTNFVQFAGALDLRLTNNFLPAPGDTFTLVKFASSSGVFSGVWNGLRIPFFGGKASFFVTYDTNLTLSAIQYADTDGDGTPDLFEDAAGTDATNAASVLRLIPVSVSGSGAVTLRFPYVSGKAYRMQWSDNVASNAWSVIASPVLVENVAGFYDWVDDGTFTGGLATPARAYRVGLGP